MPKEPVREKKHGDKMIHLNVRFWTNGIPDDFPRDAWSKGVVYAVKNPSRVIVPNGIMYHFNSFAEIPVAMQKCMRAHRIKLRPGKKDSYTFRTGVPNIGKNK